MKEFKVNEYITLKLEDKKTNIYVNGKLFNQCKFLLLDIPIDKISSFDDIESIDEVAEKLDKSMGMGVVHKYEIAPEVQFWGHCSNLQSWYENNYNTKLLHRNLAFPLLKKLTEVGDPIAKRVFKEEVAKRIDSGYHNVIQFLINEKYTDDFTIDELKLLIFKESGELKDFFNYTLQAGQSQKDTIHTLKLLKKLVDDGDPAADKVFREEIAKRLTRGKAPVISYLIDNDYLREEEIESLGIQVVYQNGYYRVIGNKYIIDASEICSGSSLFKVIIGNLSSLKKLNLSGSSIRSFPDSFWKLKSLEELNLRNNYFESLPESIGNLKSLQILNLSADRTNPYQLCTHPKEFLRPLHVLHKFLP
ncbi:MAG: leucine-rich repeat domain-containing protein, partial [Candidatus Hodarchaeota archaeon]